MGLIYRDEKICLFCKEAVDRKINYLCEDCFDQLSFNSGYFHIDHYEYVYSVLDYNKILRKHLFPYKYSNQSYYYKVFGSIILYDISKNLNLDHIDYIIPVPLHRRKKALRGYNQSELIGEYISRNLDIPILSKTVNKKEHTRDQHKLGKSARKKNLENAFSVRGGEILRDKNILIIDDVLTTGTTMIRIGQLVSEYEPAGLYGLTLSTAKE